jgi:hypothetical protein
MTDGPIFLKGMLLRIDFSESFFLCSNASNLLAAGDAGGWF